MLKIGRGGSEMVVAQVCGIEHNPSDLADLRQMALLSSNDVECEISYAYLHAVAAKSGMNCSYTI